MYHARAKAFSNSSGFSRNLLDIFSYSGSNLRARSDVSIIGLCFLYGSWASGNISGASFATHWYFPAGLFVSSHSYSNRNFKKYIPNLVGVRDQTSSNPEVNVSAPLPVL